LTSLERVVVIIPAYNAGPALTQLVGELGEVGFGALVIVDDGSAAEHQRWFARVEPHAHLLRHERNLGKGRALKTGFAFVEKMFPDVKVVVTADADGQHRPLDIARVAAAALNHPGEIVLGSRLLEGDVPWRSRLGNKLTREIVAAVAGIRLKDTQTGLRAFPRGLLPMLRRVEGDRYEYEISVLLQLSAALGRPREVPIETVYVGGNRGSHFKPVRDSVRIYRAVAVCAGQRLRRRVLQARA
jgi:glycosyltransferase involved in cell wall biosynthesis